MKKKLIICLLLVFTSLSLIGCQKEETKEMTNPDFGKYNGIYKMKDYKFKVLHIDNNIVYRLYKKNDFKVNDIIFSDEESNKIEGYDFDFEFKENSVKVKSKNKEFPSGEYVKESGYSTDEIYKDYVGDVSLFDSKYSGIYENEKGVVYSVQNNKDQVKIHYSDEEESTTIEIDYKEDNHFATDFFDTKYDLIYNDDSLVLTITDENGNDIEETYTRKSKLSKEEIIKQFYN